MNVRFRGNTGRKLDGLELPFVANSGNTFELAEPLLPGPIVTFPEANETPV